MSKVTLPVSPDEIAKHNKSLEGDLTRDFELLGQALARRSIDIEKLVKQAATFEVAIPTWGVGTGGTRFARFAGPGEPRNIHDKVLDCSVIQALVRCTSRISPHLPWDRTDDPAGLLEEATSLGLSFDAINTNTFQDFPGQEHSYKFGSLTHTSAAVRKQAVDFNIQCIDMGVKLGSKVLTVWIADGANFPGQHNIAQAFERYLESVEQIYAALPNKDWELFIEYKLFEPAFYATVIADWGTSLMVAQKLGDRAKVLVDLGHHAPNTNVEMIISRLMSVGKLGGFHFNENNYGDDDIDSGATNPYRLFLILNEIVDAAHRGNKQPVGYMLDQSHNVTDPIESLMLSAEQVQRSYVQTLLVDRAALAEHQQSNDVLLAAGELKRAFATDVSALLGEVRKRAGGAIDPLGCYRASGYRSRVAKERPAQAGTGGGIV